MTFSPGETDPLLKFRAVLAPMEGVMNPWLIRVCGRLDLVPHWITPFISVTGGSVPSRRIIRKRLAEFLETGAPVTAQILGKTPEHVGLCAERLAGTGLVKGINLNFSCPSPTVTGNGAGAALLDKPETVERITAAVREKIPPEMPLSVKLRAGFISPRTEDAVHAAVNGGAELIVFHFRTGAEMYGPVPDGLERIREAVIAAGNIPVFGNGDIRSKECAERMISETGCRGVAAARAFLEDPLLIRRINGVADERKIDLPAEMRKQGAPESTILAIGRLVKLMAGKR